MKRILPAVVSLFAALLLPSCLQSETTIHLKKDGSGTLVEQTTLGLQALAMLEQFAALGGEEGADPLTTAFSEEKAKARAASLGEGVTFEKSERINEGEKKGARVTYRFADISKLKFAPGETLNDISPAGAAAPKPEPRPFTFAYADGNLTIVMPETDKAEPITEGENPAENPQMEGMMKEMLRDMKMSFKIIADSGISETDATYHDGGTITFFDVEMGKVLEEPGVMKKLMGANQNDPKAAMEALKGLAGVKMETKNKVNVTLK